MRILLRLLIAAAVLSAVGFIGYRMINPATGTATNPTSTQGTPALFAATFPDQQGAAQALAQWRGKIVVVNFWATWCPPCREEMPELSDFQDKYASKNVVVLGISTDDAETIRAFAKKSPTRYPLLSGDFEAMALAESLGNNKGVLPFTVLVDRDGKIKRVYFGRLDMKILEQDVNALTHLS